MDEEMVIGQWLFRITQECIQNYGADFEYLIMANFFPGQLCRVKILADQIIITPETPSMSPERMCH